MPSALEEPKVPRNEHNNSWWQRVGQPESVETKIPNHNLAKLQK